MASAQASAAGLGLGQPHAGVIGGVLDGSGAAPGGGVGAAAAAEHRLGGAIELAHQLALPAVPDARAHGADVGDGQHQQQAQPLRVSTMRAKSATVRGSETSRFWA
jgi:hypothetical protein